ncbi:MAG: ATPase [Bacteroidetes bacterium RIFOXYA12_FULL_35_11]|nr:MAG: ATPase [Bacteroidetes bacterium GWF2_35_48]OFY73326.1 MAG: ATPase [Bacteroidetes bacterium RIFOXYA12_FULL_35_11]HBX52275.1 ATPase [Bacteroidales bacterium]
MNKNIIGRTEEISMMTDLLFNKHPEMLAVIGRRRVGKTYLVRNVYRDYINFEITGIQQASAKQQLEYFATQLNKISGNKKTTSIPESWLEAFFQLSTALEKIKTKKKKVLFFDELPWLASRKSGFLTALGHFWNSWASKQNIIVVICGSSASWMINKVVHNKGGLHNRITKLINLAPFTLAETKKYLKSRNIKMDHYQTIQLYMAMGGVPHYLKEIKPGLSAAQNIDTICFRKNGLLRDEFDKLYPALFEKAEKHINIIRALASKWKGLTRTEIITKSKIKDGGSLTRILSELISSGFVSSYFPFDKKKKETLYRLTDEYSLFYIHFIEKQAKPGMNIWPKLIQSQQWKSWSGFAFENICMKHTENIKKALGISGVYTEESSYIYKGNEYENGFQIDLLIDRSDDVINICEIKFHSGEFTIDKAYANILRRKINNFQLKSKTKKSMMLTFISTFGVKNNMHKTSIVENDLTIEVLFEEGEY